MLIPWRVCVYEIPRHQLSKIGEIFPQKQLDFLNQSLDISMELIFEQNEAQKAGHIFAL